MISSDSIEINLDSVSEGLRLWIDARQPKTLFDASDSASENNEANIQLVEGCFYDYQINSEDYLLADPFDNIVQAHKRRPNLGTIAPNIYVGTLELPLIQNETGEKMADIYLEVQSVKSGYRDDYRDMLAMITEKCTDLLLHANSPVSHRFEIDFNQDSKTLYQRFAFVKSVIGTDEFAEAVHRIVSMPVTKWADISETRDIRNVRRFSNSNIRQILSTGNRTVLPENHYLKGFGIKTLPERITTVRKTDSVDTPENRFIKYALETFLKFCTDINSIAKAKNHKKLYQESYLLIQELEGQLHHTVFRDISSPNTLKLNSPVLQRKEGYREVLRVWLLFDLAAKLIWKGGEDVYGAGKKDIATLYEYWLFFKLLELLEDIVSIEPKDISDLIEPTDDGLSLRIKQGTSTLLQGIYDSGSRKINIRYTYNRSFSGKRNYPDAGSWTTALRPDYTLSFWPVGISEAEAERQELIVHVHFDAKYKVANLWDYLNPDTEGKLDQEKNENRKGVYKNADLLKMHAYKDAIRRTAGAYVLYPGDKPLTKRGFHEIIPGLGAFPVRPMKTDSGIGELKAFILEIMDHFINRASQREKTAFRTFDIHKDPPESDSEIREALPEAYHSNRSLIPDETFVLVGYYHSKEQYTWIAINKLYNFRMGSGSGSLILDRETVGSRYLLLHTAGDKQSGDLWRIVSKGPKVFSKEDMIKTGYPDPSQDHYLLIRLERVSDPEFQGVSWDFKKLANYSPGRASAFPFSCSLAELMRHKIR
ncbi:hypothetical protein SAMN04488057_10122 [Cyclobacterium lianum]|uniref:DUF2357 domain-containing protein n=1 Tax=Cyclobacterium lianum TaxID=388280 RepID=A0A1M7HQV4_9BACT|nr:DUF2357 domain-containing protein [Cyclobacterium lianum]SHM30896.1 hypothetical protein SAMN04488057_10122 [Cyclobacterium lianum]